MDRLFVYGTLRLGSNNRYAQHLADAARYLGAAQMAGRLFRVAHYPALVPTDSELDTVKGDVFEGINNELWQLLDEYEGPEYARDVAKVNLDTGDVVEAHFYRYLAPVDSLERIRSGDWSHPDRSSP